MIFHENCRQADNSHELLFLKKQQNLKLSSAAKCRWRFKDLPGQALLLQFLCSSAVPVQFCPCGALIGNSHCLVLNCVPAPHVVLHIAQLDQLPHIPSTGKQVEVPCYGKY